MKKKLRFTAWVLIPVFAAGLLALAPYFFHNPKSPGTSTAVAFDGNPRNSSLKGSFTTVSFHSTVEKPLKQEPKLQQTTQVSQKSLPLVYEKPAIKTNPKPITVKSNQTKVVAKIAISQKEQPTEKTAPDPAERKEKPSSWGISLLAAKNGVDAGISYRLVELPLLNGIDLDMVAGLKHAGVALSKYVYKNLGVGLAGTIAYSDGQKNLGIYVKYAF